MKNVPDLRDYPDDTVIMAKVRFSPGGPVYTYVAVKAVGKWFTTARITGWGSNACTNAEYRERLGMEAVREVWVVSEWEQVGA